MARAKTTINAIVVEMADYNSRPAVPRGGWGEVSPKPEKIPREQRYTAFKKENFRSIREAFQQLTINGQSKIGQPETILEHLFLKTRPTCADR